MSISRFFRSNARNRALGSLAINALPGSGLYPLTRKGGDANWHVFECSDDKEVILQEENISLSNTNPTDSQRVNLLMRAADLVRERGEVRPLSDVPAIEESIGIIYNQVRRRRKISLDRIARATGFTVEEIIAFEAGLLPRMRMCEMLPNLSREVGVDIESLFLKNRSQPK